MGSRALIYETSVRRKALQGAYRGDGCQRVAECRSPTGAAVRRGGYVRWIDGRAAGQPVCRVEDIERRILPGDHAATFVKLRPRGHPRAARFWVSHWAVEAVNVEARGQGIDHSAAFPCAACAGDGSVMEPDAGGEEWCQVCLSCGGSGMEPKN